VVQIQIINSFEYVAFFGNLGNYKSFGDTKFVPGTTPSKLRQFLSHGNLSAAEIDKYFDGFCVERMYSLPPRHRQLGLGASNGISTYFSHNCTEADATLAGKFLDSINLSPYNTRLFKIGDDSGTGEASYIVLVASAKDDSTASAYFPFEPSYVFEGKCR
jgi:dipeptidyl-peptidase III